MDLDVDKVLAYGFREGDRYNLPGIGNGNKYLTRKESEIVTLLVSGKRAKEIAWELNSSLHTINTHLANIKIKLECANIFELGLLLGSLKVREGI